MHKLGKADVNPVRQQTQYNCVTTSLAMALQALGVSEEECRIERVNKVVGAMPLQGAAWEPMLAAANHYGMRATLTLPSTVAQLKSWTDAGKPVVIAWNPEGREWSHASLVFDVTEDAEHGFLVHIADPNIPDPEETVRVVPKKEFYSKWYEKAPQGYMIRRPACFIEREITAEGRQVMASSSRFDTSREVREHYEAREMARGLAKEERWYQERVNQGFAYMVYALLEGYAVLHDDPGVSWFATKNRELRKFESVLPNKVLQRLEKESSIQENHKVFILDKLTELHNLWRKLDPYDFSDTYSSDWSVVKAKVVDRVAPSWLAPYIQAKKSFKSVAGRPLSDRSDKNVVDSALSEKFAILDKLISNGFPQAQAAAQAVKDAYTSGGKPSEDQLKALRNMMYRSKMMEEADQFRVASFWNSASRVVQAYLDKQAEEHDCLQDYRGGGLSRAEYEDCVQRARAMERGYTRSPRPSSDPHLTKKLEILNRLIQNRPSDFLISVRDQLAYRGSLSPKQQEAVRKWLRDPNEVALFGGLPPAKAPTQSGPTAQEAQLGALGNLLVRNPNSFVSSIHQQVAQGKSLTDNQKSAIRRVFYQAGMRSDADLFR
jgi:hypothetical protein